MKILICGYGFVGKAHALALESKDVKVHVYDPALGYDVMPHDIDAVIIAVSTPQAKDGSCDMSNVYNVLSWIPNNVPVLIKSTISLEGWQLINRAFPDSKITFSPEYLRAAHAWEDFKNQKEVYVGGGDVAFWASLFSMRLGVKVIGKNPEELILAKYTRNSFLALKVSFFNQLYDLCESTGVNFNSVRELVTEDSRVGTSHSYVEEERGFGGHCFPKDTSALLETAKYFGDDMSILREAVEYNKRIRGE